MHVFEYCLKRLFQNKRLGVLLTRHQIEVLYQYVMINIQYSKELMESFNYAIHRIYDLLL